MESRQVYRWPSKLRRRFAGGLVRANCYVAQRLTCCDGVLSMFAQVIEVQAAPGGHKKYAAELGGRLPNAYGLS